MTSSVKIGLSDVLERLRQCGLRMTRNRESLVEVLIGSDHPLSADEIREKAGFASTDLVTVYRNLEAFQSAGLLQRIPLENGSQLFELTDLNDHYHHLIYATCLMFFERFNAIIGVSSYHHSPITQSVCIQTFPNLVS